MMPPPRVLDDAVRVLPVATFPCGATRALKVVTHATSEQGRKDDQGRANGEQLVHYGEKKFVASMFVVSLP